MKERAQSKGKAVKNEKQIAQMDRKAFRAYAQSLPPRQAEEARRIRHRIRVRRRLRGPTEGGFGAVLGRFWPSTEGQPRFHTPEYSRTLSEHVSLTFVIVSRAPETFQR
jgi:hypothetical protein